MPLPKPRTEPHVVLEDVIPALNSARREVEDTRAAHQDAVARRDRLIVRAIDQGTLQRTVVEAAGISKGRVIAILAASEHEQESAGV